MIDRLRHLLDWMLLHALGATVRSGGEPGEQAASIQLYPTQGRDVQAAPKKRPRAVDATAAVIHERQAHGRSK